MLKLKVITPTKVISDELVENVSVPTVSGMITILNNHIPIVSPIRHGEMTIRKDGIETSYAVHHGVVNVEPHTEGVTQVIVLLEDVEAFDDKDAILREQALTRARDMSKEKEDEFSFGAFESQIERELSKVKFTIRKN